MCSLNFASALTTASVGLLVAAQRDRNGVDHSTLHVRELLFGTDKAYFESLDLAEPALGACLCDAGDEIVADLDQAVLLGRIGPEHRASDAGVLVDAGGAERASACADRDLAPLEVAQELLPFIVGRRSVLLVRPQGSPAGEKGEMCLNGVVGVDGLWGSQILEL